MSIILPESRAGVGELRGRVASMVRVLRLPGLAPSQAPQSARREDEGEDPSHAERVKRPDEQEGWGGLGDLAAKNASRSHHVDDGPARRKERPDEHDDVPRPPFGEHQRSVQPDDQDGHRNEGRAPCLGRPNPGVTVSLVR